MEEIWKDIKGYEGLYQVSNLGRIKRVLFKNNKTTIIKEKILKYTVKNNGYCKVNLYKNNKQKTYHIHRLVAEAFIPNRDNSLEINHKDGNKKNNCINNLEWITHKENIQHGVKTGLITNIDKAKNVLQFDKSMNQIGQYNSVKEVARKLGYDATSIAGCCRSKKYCKTAYGYIWRYA